MLAKKPFKFVHVSATCSSTYGLSPEHLVNRTLSVIQGLLTNFDAWTAAPLVAHPKQHVFRPTIAASRRWT